MQIFDATITESHKRQARIIAFSLFSFDVSIKLALFSTFFHTKDIFTDD